MQQHLILELKKNIFSRAKIFIEDMGSFTPFAATSDGKTIKDLIAYEDFDGSVDVIKLIDLLKNGILQEFNNGLLMASAIAYDVTINLENSDKVLEKRNALCLLVTKDGKNWYDEYFPYRVTATQCVWR